LAFFFARAIQQPALETRRKTRWRTGRVATVRRYAASISRQCSALGEIPVIALWNVAPSVLVCGA
jgi:hypothetical protein